MCPRSVAYHRCSPEILFESAFSWGRIRWRASLRLKYFNLRGAGRLNKVRIRGGKGKFSPLSQFKICSVVGCQLIAFGEQENLIEGPFGGLVDIHLDTKAGKLPGVIEEFITRNLLTPERFHEGVCNLKRPEVRDVHLCSFRNEAQHRNGVRGLSFLEAP